MKERPILFSGPMVRAILEGRKTQTRRIVKPQPYESEYNPGSFGVVYKQPKTETRNVMRKNRETGEFEETASTTKKGSIIMAQVTIDWWKDKCPYGQPGDRLWVRETHWVNRAWDDIRYKATDPEWPYGWTPSIHMYRKASRIILEVVSTRIERLQSITDHDAMAEGVGPCYGSEDGPAPWVDVYEELWESINGKGAWDENPWVWVIEFRRVRS